MTEVVGFKAAAADERRKCATRVSIGSQYCPTPDRRPKIARWNTAREALGKQQAVVSLNIAGPSGERHPSFDVSSGRDAGALKDDTLQTNDAPTRACAERVNLISGRWSDHSTNSAPTLHDVEAIPVEADAVSDTVT